MTGLFFISFQGLAVLSPVLEDPGRRASPLHCFRPKSHGAQIVPKSCLGYSASGCRTGMKMTSTPMSHRGAPRFGAAAREGDGVDLASAGPSSNRGGRIF